MPRASTRRTGVRKAISLLDIPLYRDYTFAFFSEAAIKLCTGKDLDELNQQTLNDIIVGVSNCIREEIEKLRTRNIDPCNTVPVPTTGNDPRDKMSLCHAYKTLTDFSMGVKHESFVLPSAFSLEFTEFTRSFMGSGKPKREIFIIDEEVLALAVLGSYLTHSYAIGGEYGYIYIDVVPYILALERVRKMNSIARRLIYTIQKNEGSINTILLGIATAARLSIKEFIKDVARSDFHVIANFLRMSRTGTKVMVKGFDSIDVIQLVKIIGRGGIAGALYRMLARYPKTNFTSLRRFIEMVSINLIKFQSFRKPQYIYEILRYLTSDELNREGAQWYVKKNGEGLGWSDIVNRFSNLSRLVS